MKWLNIITNEPTFIKIDYELFNSQEDFDTYAKTTNTLKDLVEEKYKASEIALDKINKYASKAKKPVYEVYSFTPDEYGYGVFTALDAKVDKFVKILNENYIYLECLPKYIYGQYKFSDYELENIPELNELPWTENRFVNAVSFSNWTSWEKLKIPEELRHNFVASMIMTTIDEEIV